MDDESETSGVSRVEWNGVETSRVRMNESSGMRMEWNRMEWNGIE